MRWPVVPVLAVLLLSTVMSGASAGQVSSTPCDPNAPTCAAGGVVEDGRVTYGGGEASSPGGHPPTPVAFDECEYTYPDRDFERERAIYDGTIIPLGAVIYWRDCLGDVDLLWYVPGQPETHDVVGPLVQRAIDSVEAPVPELVTSPPLGSEVVTGMPVYLSVSDGAYDLFEGSVSAGQFTVSASLRPVSSRFSPGDGGDARTCDGPGSVWSYGDRPSAGDCTHTFTATPLDVFGAGESFPVTAQVTYEASYTVSGPVLAGTYDLGTLEGPEVTVDVPVRERRAVRIASAGR